MIEKQAAFIPQINRDHRENILILLMIKGLYYSMFGLDVKEMLTEYDKEMLDRISK